MQGLLLVLWLALCGMSAGAAWTVFAAFHHAFELKGFWGIIIDFLCPAAFAAIIWLGVIFVIDGDTRAYAFICIGMGVVLYSFTVKEWVFVLFYKIFADIRKIIGFILKILLTPVRFLYKIVCVCVHTKKRTPSAETENITNDSQT